MNAEYPTVQGSHEGTVAGVLELRPMLDEEPVQLSAQFVVERYRGVQLSGHTMVENLKTSIVVKKKERGNFSR